MISSSDSNAGESIDLNRLSLKHNKDSHHVRQLADSKNKYQMNNPLTEVISFKSKNSSQQSNPIKILPMSEEGNKDNNFFHYQEEALNISTLKDNATAQMNNTSTYNNLTITNFDNNNISFNQDNKNNILNISTYNNNINLTNSDIHNQTVNNSILTLNPRNQGTTTKLSNSIASISQIADLDNDNNTKLRFINNNNNSINVNNSHTKKNNINNIGDSNSNNINNNNNNASSMTFGSFAKKVLKKEDTIIKNVLTSLSNNNNVNVVNNINSKSMFFMPDRIQKLKHYFKVATKRINTNQDEFINGIHVAIQDNNLHRIRALMLTKDNQTMFKQQLSDPTVLNLMLVQSRMEILNEVLKDPFYKLDGTFVFEYLSKKLKQKGQLLEDIDNISQFISNVVKYKLYRKSLTRVLGWFIICLGFNDTFVSLVKANEKEYSLECIQFNQFETDDDIRNYFEEPANYRRVLILCLKEKLEHLAIELIIYHGSLENSEVIESAIQFNSKMFLRYIWEATSCGKKNLELPAHSRRSRRSVIMSSSDMHSHSHHHHQHQQQEATQMEGGGGGGGGVQKKKSHIFTMFEASMKQTIFNKGNSVFMISDLIDKIYKIGNKELIVEIVLLWKFLDKDRNLLQALLNNKSYDEISILLYRYPYSTHWKFTENNFKDIIENNGLDLILLCLHDVECRAILENTSIQDTIVSQYLSEGEKMYYGAEMLSYISKTSFDLSLVPKLLNTINMSIKKSKIVNCHSPVLTCLLLCEFISYLGEISVHFETKCRRTREDLMIFCRNVQEAKPNDQYVKFLLGQKDSRGRAAYHIAAEIEAYAVLQSPEVGTIVNKMWVGKISFDSFFDYSSIYRFISNQNPDETNPFKSFKAMDSAKSYFHQLALWKESCSIRFIPESVLTVLLIILYNLFIYFLVITKSVMANTNELSSGMQVMLITYIIWVICIALNTPLQVLYCYLSDKRKYSLDRWGIIDICLFFACFFLLIDTEKVFPSRDDKGNIIPSNGKSDFAFILRATILSINNVLVWLRITSILITYRELGPLIRMIYQLSIYICQYLVVIIIIMICFATFFTTVFFRVSQSFSSYLVTFTTLFQGFLNNSDCFDFTSYKLFGAVSVLIFVTACGLVLVNGPIALLSNKYTQLSKVVDAAHRSVLITYYRRFKWDKNYGYLIFFAPPLSVLNFITMPINILFRKNMKVSKEVTIGDKTSATIAHNEKLCAQTARQQLFNQKICKVYFSLFYFPVIALCSLICNIIFIPIGYIIGFGKCISSPLTGNAISWSNGVILFCWIICGPFMLVFRVVIDLFDMTHTIFVEPSSSEKESEKGYLKEAKNFREEIKNFITFIHKREKSEQNDLNSIFLDYLEYEHIKRAEMDEEMKRETQQFNRLRKEDKTQSKNHNILSLMYGKKSNKGNNNLKSSFEFENDIYYEMKMRNVIIIQILQNFVIKGERNDIFIVDIEKMKMLLPLTMNINNAYMKKLLYTNITILNRAVAKKKSKANPFLQHKMLNVIASSVIRLNSLIDGELHSDPLQTDEAKAKYGVDIQDNEDNFFTEIADLLEKMEIDITDSITKEEKMLYEEERKTHGLLNHHQHHRSTNEDKEEDDENLLP